jgi:methionyl-tRNA formyltransferase
MKIVFMGSADFGIYTLKRLLECHEIACVVSTPAKPRGRGLKMDDSPITRFAREMGIAKILTPENLRSEEFKSELESIGADIFIVVAFRILPRAIFSIPKYGTLNIHASLLPKYRGPAPIHRAIQAGDKESGVTIFRIDEGVDTGEILLQDKIPISDQETTPSLYEKLSLLGADLLVKSLDGLGKGSLTPILQDSQTVSRAPKLSKDEALIDWSNSARTIYNKIRAFKPFPGTYCMLDGKRLGIEWAQPVEDSSTGDIASIVNVTNSFFDVQCNPGVLRIFEVKPEGRKGMDVHSFLLGKRLLKGTILK